MPPTTAPLLVGCVLLVLGGAPKIADPTSTVGALRSVGVRVPPTAVRVLGAAEAVLGLTTAVLGGVVQAALVAGSYAAFTGFLVVALSRGGAVSSCGCVGRDDTPPTRAHVAVTVLCALSAAAAAATDATGLAALGWSADTVVLVGFTALAGWLAWLVFAALPHVTVKET